MTCPKGIAPPWRRARIFARAAGEDAFGALADDDLDFGVGILTAGSDEGGSED